MDDAITTGEAGFRLTVDQKMTLQFADGLEDTILDALCRYKLVEVDLSKVKEIDLYGAHLLGLLQAFSAKGLVLVGTSSAVDEAFRRFREPLCMAKPTRPANRLGNTKSAAKRRRTLSTSYEDHLQY